ncbi:Histidine triad (HIT) protein (plasmid) [Legionella adelaidensis]|uniref:Histidine triad (HIT) protein n=1 Tax=Legionella adelaidensis TaxID=45056 RepID=A0A0W0R0N3_9GAMM|nr:HIT family protein [Legionella adelaidensis]KTC64652.1 Histidine triad (HIT) protein [Legionella adelaidensis]VEH86120.1 Histidine triad (HIT) protein [Legionella adelaidensis]
MNIPCIVESIITRETKAFIIFEDADFISFLDHRPVFYGHTLVCPKKHYATLYDLPQELIQPFFLLVQQIGKAVELGMSAMGSFIAMNNKVSQSVPHLHVHIIPRSKGDGLKGFFWPRLTYKEEEHMLEVQQKIIQYL